MVNVKGKTEKTRTPWIDKNPPEGISGTFLVHFGGISNDPPFQPHFRHVSGDPPFPVHFHRISCDLLFPAHFQRPGRLSKKIQPFPTHFQWPGRLSKKIQPRAARGWAQGNLGKSMTHTAFYNDFWIYDYIFGFFKLTRGWNEFPRAG